MSLERNSKLINRKFIMYLVPSILMIFAMQFGSLVDGILVGNFIGNDALSASSLVLPILYIVQIPGFAIGVGGAIVVANLLGKRDIVGAKKAFSFSMIVGMSISIEDIKFGDSASENLFKREISVLVTKNSDKSVIFNLRLNDSLLRNMCSSFKKVKIDTNFNKESIFFDWYLQVGKTKLAFDVYKNLEQFDIIFLDDCSSFQSKRYAMKGLGNVVVNGELKGSSFVVKGKCS